MVRFNTWEVIYARSIPGEKRADQFAVLFEMSEFYPQDVIEGLHREHLRSLIESQARLSAGWPAL